jgi:cytochrome b561
MLIAKTRRIPLFFEATHLRDRAPALQRCMVYSVVMAGAFGQVHDSLMPPASPWSNLHLEFGALLLCSTIMRVFTRRAHRTPDSACDLLATRQLARLVYLLLYSLAGLRELAGISIYLWQGGTFDLGWVMIGNPHVGLQPKLSNLDSFQIYVVYGVIAIFTIRAEPLVFWNRVK